MKLCEMDGAHSAGCQLMKKGVPADLHERRLIGFGRRGQVDLNDARNEKAWPVVPAS